MDAKLLETKIRKEGEGDSVKFIVFQKYLYNSRVFLCTGIDRSFYIALDKAKEQVGIWQQKIDKGDFAPLIRSNAPEE